MKPWKTIATDGKWTLRQRDHEFMVQVDGKILMTSRRHGSEDELARAGVRPDMVRLSVGIEEVEDILWDIDQALRRAV